MAPRLGVEKLTIKQRKLIKGIVEGKTLKDSAIAAGFSGKGETARVEAHRTLRKPHVAEALEHALNEAGVTLKKQAQVVAEAMDATKLQSIGFKVHEVPDHAIRLDAVKTAAKWRGIGDRDDSGGQVVGVGFFIVKGLQDRGLNP